MADKVYTWPDLIQSSDTLAGYFNTPVSELTFTTIKECFDEMYYHLLDAIDIQIASDTGYFNMGTAAYEASKILAEKGLDAVYDKLHDRMTTDGEDIDEYILVKINPVAHTIWKRSYQSSYESVQYNANLTAIHKDDFINMVNNYAYTNNSFSIYSATFRYFYNSNSRMTYTHKQYQATISSYSITPSDIASDGGYSKIYNGTNINVTNAGSNIYVQNIMGGHIEGTGTSTGSSSLYTSSCGAVFSNVLCTVRDLYNPDGSDTSTSGKYPSSEMGGLGTFDDHTDLSDISTKPSLNISNLGFFSIWNPSISELKSLADFVWNDPTNWQQWPQIFQSGILKPLDYIISLSVLPIPSSALSTASTTFCMGGIIFDGRVTALGINLSMNQVQEQFVDINLGSISLKEYFGSFLDYAPYSQVSIYLPFYGVAELSMNELQNADSIQLVYRINVLDGSCAIKLLVDRQTSAAQNGSIPLKHVLYEYYTNVKTDVPLTQGANTEHLKMAATMITAAVAMAAPIAGAGAAALAGGAGAAVGGSATMADILGSASASAAANGGKIAAGIQAGAQGAQKMVNAMPSGGGMQRGNISGMSSGLLSERKPFLIVTRPIQVLPEFYKEEMGYTASIKASISDIGSGFVKFDSIDLSSLDCEESERMQILDLLTSTGVYI